MLDIQPILFGDNFNYLLHTPDSSALGVVDLANGNALARDLSAKQLRPTHLFLTHHHFDHIADLEDFIAHFPEIQVFKPEGEDRIEVPAIEVNGSSTIEFGTTTVRALLTHAHTRHCAAYLFDQIALFTGDALFQAGCGRLFEGSAHDLEEAMDLFTSLPPHTQLYFGHEYGLVNLRFAQFIEPGNPHVKAALQQLKQKLALGEYGVPGKLEEELQTNPFLRIDEPSLLKLIDPDRCLERQERLHQIRRKRDHF